MSFLRALSAADEVILRRAAREPRHGDLVNLGIGLPTLLPRYLPKGVDVVFHSENGFLGMGPPFEGGTPDHPVIDAGGRASTILPGGACFDSVMSFAIVRGGNLDLAVLGAFEVSLAGDLANWKIPGKYTPGMGGGGELAQKAKRVLVVSRHLNKQGEGKLVERCSLPLTARACVDTVITERGVFRLREGAMQLTETAPGVSRDEALEGVPAGVGVAGDLHPWEADHG